MTRERRRELYQLLNEMALSGDVAAAGWLLLLDEIRHQRNMEPETC